MGLRGGIGVPDFIPRDRLTLGVTGGTIVFLGATTFSGNLLAPDGTVSLPAYSWSSEPSSGFYRAGAGDFRFSILGVRRLTMTVASLTYAGDVNGNNIAGANGVTGTITNAVAGVEDCVAAIHNVGAPAAGDGASFLCQASSLAGNGTRAASFAGVHDDVTSGVEVSSARVMVGMAGVLEEAARFTRPAGTITFAPMLTSAIGANPVIYGVNGVDAPIDIRPNGDGRLRLCNGNNLPLVSIDRLAGADLLGFYNAVPIAQPAAITGTPITPTVAGDLAGADTTSNAAIAAALSALQTAVNDIATKLGTASGLGLTA